MPKKLESKACRICGEAVQRQQRQDRKAFYYPRQCQNCFKKDRDPIAHSENMKRFHAEHGHPRQLPLGTRRLHKSGENSFYWEIKIGPGRTQWEYEHRLIAQSLIGRALQSNEIVHHDNENSLDNTPTNLIVLTKAEHAIVHFSLPPERWSLHFDHCQDCLGISRKHISKGLCSSCYQKQDRLANLEAFRARDKARRLIAGM